MEVLFKAGKTASLIQTRAICELVKEADKKLLMPYVAQIDEIDEEDIIENYTKCITEGFGEPYAYHELMMSLFFSSSFFLTNTH